MRYRLLKSFHANSNSEIPYFVSAHSIANNIIRNAMECEFALIIIARRMLTNILHAINTLCCRLSDLYLCVDDVLVNRNEVIKKRRSV